MVKIMQDREFIFAAINGNQNAIDTLIRRNEQLVRNVVRRRLSDSFYEDDVVQEILLKAICKLETFQSESSFSTWLYRLSVNHVLDYIKKKRALTVAIPDTYCSETEHNDTTDRNDLVHKYFEILIIHMKEEYRLAMVLADIFDMPHREAARYLKVTPLNFRKRLSRARLQMRLLIDTKNYLNNRSAESNGPNAKEAETWNSDVERVRLFIAKKIAEQYLPSQYAA
jgi:RNA polymerase sigma factor (sigma-70 family)